MSISALTIFLRLAAALVCGSIIGLEREHRDRAAGLRTHALVAIASCIIMLTSTYGFLDVLSAEHIALDPSRIAAQAVCGIGFLAGGVIIYRNPGISGLTTAGTLWTSMGLGLACGGGLFSLASLGSGFVLFVQFTFRQIEIHFFSHHRQSIVEVKITSGAGLAAIHQLINELKIPLRSIQTDSNGGEQTERIILVIDSMDKTILFSFIERLHGLKAVTSINAPELMVG